MIYLIWKNKAIRRVICTEFSNIFGKKEAFAKGNAQSENLLKKPNILTVVCVSTDNQDFIKSPLERFQRTFYIHFTQTYFSTQQPPKPSFFLPKPSVIGGDVRLH